MRLTCSFRYATVASLSLLIPSLVHLGSPSTESHQISHVLCVLSKPVYREGVISASRCCLMNDIHMLFEGIFLSRQETGTVHGFRTRPQ
jgi:hypothetical protein